MGLEKQIVSIMREVLGGGTHAIHAPSFYGNEKSYLNNCIDSSFVSSVGSYVDRFEKDLAEFTGAQRAVAVVNGTAALQVALQLVGVSRGDEVIVPALTFVATANAVQYIGAVPHFADSAESTLGLDPIALRDWLNYSTERSVNGIRNRTTGRLIRAFIPMHTFGHPCDLEGLLAIAHDFDIVMIEDAAESLGSYYHGQHTGTFGSVGTISFNGNKIITTGGGGAILTNQQSLAERAKHLTTTAKKPHRWAYDHDDVGYNFRMPNLNAALGCAQLEKLPDFLASKRMLFERYKKAFSTLGDVEIKSEMENCRSNYWLQTMILKESVANQRDVILEATNEVGLMTRPAWRLIHELQPYQACPRAPLPVAESLAKRIINLPSSAGLA